MTNGNFIMSSTSSGFNQPDVLPATNIVAMQGKIWMNSHRISFHNCIFSIECLVLVCRLKYVYLMVSCIKYSCFHLRLDPLNLVFIGPSSNPVVKIASTCYGFGIVFCWYKHYVHSLFLELLMHHFPVLDLGPGSWYHINQKTVPTSIPADSSWLYICWNQGHHCLFDRVKIKSREWGIELDRKQTGSSLDETLYVLTIPMTIPYGVSHRPICQSIELI